MAFADFVINGQIGMLHPRISREEVLKVLGPPPNWIGRPPNIGFQIESFEESDVWMFYEDSVGVRFGEDGVAVETIIYPNKIERCPVLFSQWPIQNNPTLGDWRLVLQSRNLSFRESNPEGTNYWIVAENTCVAYGLPKDGREVHGYEIPALLIGKYSGTDEMFRSCEFLTMD
jgi:hypothetical protein